MKNKKGNAFLGITLAVVIWVFGILMIPYVIETIDSIRADISCSGTISGGNMLVCLMIDGITPYLIWTIGVIALGLIIGGYQ